MRDKDKETKLIQKYVLKISSSQEYLYNVQICNSVDNGKSYYYSGNGKFFKNKHEANVYIKELENKGITEIMHIDDFTDFRWWLKAHLDTAPVDDLWVLALERKIIDNDGNMLVAKKSDEFKKLIKDYVKKQVNSPLEFQKDIIKELLCDIDKITAQNWEKLGIKDWKEVERKDAEKRRKENKERER